MRLDRLDAVVVAEAHLLDDGYGSVQVSRHVPCVLPAPNVCCGHHEIRDGPLLEVPGEHPNGRKLVQGYVEEALYLAGRAGPTVNTLSAPDTSMRFATSLAVIGTRGWSFLSLRPIGVERDHRRNTARGGPLGGVDHDQQLEQVVIYRDGDGLYQEDVTLADVFLYADEGVVVAELERVQPPLGHAEVGADIRGQGRVGVSSEYLEVVKQGHQAALSFLIRGALRHFAL